MAGNEGKVVIFISQYDDWFSRVIASHIRNIFVLFEIKRSNKIYAFRIKT